MALLAVIFDRIQSEVIVFKDRLRPEPVDPGGGSSGGGARRDGDRSHGWGIDEGEPIGLSVFVHDATVFDGVVALFALEAFSF